MWLWGHEWLVPWETAETYLNSTETVETGNIESTDATTNLFGNTVVLTWPNPAGDDAGFAAACADKLRFWNGKKS